MGTQKKKELRRLRDKGNVESTIDKISQIQIDKVDLVAPLIGEHFVQEKSRLFGAVGKDAGTLYQMQERGRKRKC